MDKRQLQPALREWRDHMSAPLTLLVFVAVAIVLTIVVPFGAAAEIPAVGRFGYWLLIVVTTYGAGAFINGMVGRLLTRSLPMVIAVSCFTTGAAISVLVTGINYAVLGHLPALSDLPIYLGNIFVIAFIIAGLFYALSKPDAVTTALPPSILDRLPYDKRGRLMALSVEDHYVRIMTSKGADVVLLRLTDAMRETGDVAGLQVHRSHWIAIWAVKSVRRDGDRAIMTLTTGEDIPVSRRYMPDIKEAGLLART